MARFPVIPAIAISPQEATVLGATDVDGVYVPGASHPRQTNRQAERTSALPWRFSSLANLFPAGVSVMVTPARSKIPPITDVEAELYARAARWIGANWQKRIGLREVAAQFGVSAFHFHRRFKLTMGRTVKDLITAHQIERAKELLATDLPIAQVASQCAFAHHSHFTSRFKQCVGTTPGQFRKALHPDRGTK